MAFLDSIDLRPQDLRTTSLQSWSSEAAFDGIHDELG